MEYLFGASCVAAVVGWLLMTGHLIARTEYRAALAERDKWKQAAELSAGAMKKMMRETGTPLNAFPPSVRQGMQFSAGGVIRQDQTKDRPGDYSPLPDETPEQLVARLDAAAVRDWERQWEALTGKAWDLTDEACRLEAQRAAAAQDAVVHAEMDRQTRILNRMKRYNPVPPDEIPPSTQRVIW